MRSSNAYNTYIAKSSKEEYLTVTANANAVKRDYQIASVKVATAAYVESPSGVSKGIEGTINVSDNKVNLDGVSLLITLDGVTKKIDFTGTYEIEGESSFQSKFQDLLDAAFGDGRIKVEVKSDENNTWTLSLTPNSSASTLTVAEVLGQGAEVLGLKAGQSNKINLDSTLLGLQNQFDIDLKFNSNNEVKFSINGKEFTFSGNETLRQVINKINSSDAGVTLYYSSITDTFRLESKATGSAQQLDFADVEGNFLSALKFDSNQIVEGTDAVLEIKTDKGEVAKIIRSSNTFTIDGVTYNLKKDFSSQDGDYIDVTVTRDITKAFENIKSFVEEYNKLIDKINSELKEEKFSDYPPLTEAQKEEMTEKEIELWEEKARSGMLRNDPILQNIVYSMRRALIEGVEGVSIGLASIGITTGIYTEGGKLHISDEKKLKEALETKGDEIMMLFCKESEIEYSPDLTAEERAKRYKESGLMQRIYDIIEDNIRTKRDKDGRKGILLEKAGIVGDTSEFKNIIYDQLKDMDKRINDAIERMYKAEERYWRQFTALETALQQMYSQSAWLFQQLGMGMN